VSNKKNELIRPTRNKETNEKSKAFKEMFTDGNAASEKKFP
jgi:hypothetical protein